MLRAVNTLFSSARRQFGYSSIPFESVRPPEGKTDRLLSPEGAKSGLRFLVWQREQGQTKTRLDKRVVRPSLPSRVAEDVVGLLAQGLRLESEDRELTPGDIAILCRTNEQLGVIQAALQDRCVPTVMHGDASIFDTVDSAEILRVLRAMASAGDVRSLRSALTTRIVGLGRASTGRDRWR